MLERTLEYGSENLHSNLGFARSSNVTLSNKLYFSEPAFSSVKMRTLIPRSPRAVKSL